MSIEIPMSVAVTEFQESIQQNNDLFGGKRALFLNREVYIPRLDEQEDAEYDAMVRRTPFYILFPGVVRGFVGSTFQKDPKQNIPDLDMFKNIDLLGNTLNQYVPNIVKQVLKHGFSATIVGFSDKQKRPFATFIKPENFISQKIKNIKGIPHLVRFVYNEFRDEDNPESEFETKTFEYRVVHDLQANEEDQNLTSYRVRVYKETKEKSGIFEQDGNAIYPLKDSKTLTQIPIVIHGTAPNNFTITRTPLMDIADLNISVIQRTVDQTHMLHYTALPTPWITGVAAKEIPDTVGPEHIWGISNEMAKVGLLEFSGASAIAHQDFIDNLKLIMAQIGAQILKQEGLSRETATSVLIRSNNQTSIIETIIDNISSQMITVIELLLDWAQEKYDDIIYELNTDFVRVDMDPNAQIALVKSWLDGAISYETVFEKLQQGEIVPADRSIEEEREYISKNPSPQQIAAKEELAIKKNPPLKQTGSNLALNNGLKNPLESNGQQ